MADGALYVAVGASRSGKTAWVRQQLLFARYDVQLVWDVEGQYRDQGATVLTTRQALIDRVRAVCNSGNPRGRIAYMPLALDNFGFWSDCAFALVRGCNLRGLRCAIVAEELADVTTPGKAPDAWGMLIRRGLKYGADIYAITQRPAESDKTVMGNASVIHCCGLQRAADRKYMAAEMDLDVSQLASLDRSRLEYVHKDMRTGETKRDFLPRPGR